MSGKKGIALLSLVAALLLVFMSAAAGEAEYHDVECDMYLFVSEISDVLAVTDKAYKEYLADWDGTPLTAHYYRIGDTDGQNFIVRRNNNEVHDVGVVNRNGETVVPFEYGDIKLISDRWIIGCKLKECSQNIAKTYFDKKSGNKTVRTYYTYDSVDVYYCGKRVGTLTSFDSAQAYGDYIHILLTSKVGKFYNKDFEASTYKSKGYGEEYDTSKYYIVHCGSDQKAFAPECTLTENEVLVSVCAVKDEILDLQGNVLGKVPDECKYVNTFHNGYAKVTGKNNKVGLIDTRGNLVVPLLYDSISTNYYLSAPYGYVGAVKDGMFGFVSIGGDVAADFIYPSDTVTDYGTFAVIRKSSSDYTVISGLAGEFPEHYQELNMDSGRLAIAVKNSNGEYGVLGLNGEELVPYSNEYKSMMVNRSGTLAACQLGWGYYRVWRFGETEATWMPEKEPAVQITAPAEEANPAPAEPQEEPRPAGTDAQWACPECGKEDNTGNFCTGCGAKRPEEPEEDPVWTCPSCGKEDNDGNFCANCGKKRPDPVWTCPECGKEENDGNFCANCGTPRP